MAKLPTDQLLALVQALLPTNHNREITALDVRTVFDAVIDTLTQENVVQAGAGPYTAQDDDRGNLIVVNSAGAFALALPQPGSGGFFAPGWSTDVLNLGAGVVTITPQGGATINGAANIVLAQNMAAAITTDGTNYFAIVSVASGGVGSTVASIIFIVDGGGVPITPGVKGDLPIDFNCTIVRNTMLADQVGSIVLDIWKDTFANYPPTVADSICAAAKPTITAADKSQNLTLVGWTTVIAAGDTLRLNVDSAATITRVTLSLRILK